MTHVYYDFVVDIEKSFALVGYPVRLSAGSFHYRSTSRLEITSFKIDVSNVEIQKYVDDLNQLLFY